MKMKKGRLNRRHVAGRWKPWLDLVKKHLATDNWLEWDAFLEDFDKKVKEEVFGPKERKKYYLAANARIAELEAENMCDACGGTGKPESGLPRMCGGTGKMSDAALYLRKREVETFLKGRE